MPKRSLRSTRGCWTCRVRHKKCDETHPACETCQSLSITCYGYGDRPAWMDNGDAEKAMIGNLKSSVRLKTRRRKPLLRTASILSSSRSSSISASSGMKQRPISNLMPSTDDAESFQPDQSSDTLSSVGSQNPGSSVVSDGETHLNTSYFNFWADHTRTAEASDTGARPIISPSPYPHGRDAISVMHFFDHVFPFQFPGYKPLIQEGGRGWYLSLMLANQPLYHSVMFLSAYHRESSIRRKGLISCNEVNLEELEKHNTLSFQTLQDQLKNNCSRQGQKAGLGTLAGIVQMMFFQCVFTDDDYWRIHLEMSLVMIHDIFTEVIHSIDFKKFKMTSEDTPAFVFYCGLLIWLDVMSSVSFGKAPCLTAMHNELVKSLPCHFRLQDIIGCESWAIQIIGRIASLNEWKIQHVKLGKLSIMELVRKADEIKKDLELGLANNLEDILNKSTNDNLHNGSSVTSTRVFALAALIYLHVTVSGPRNEIEEIKNSVHQTIVFLKEIKESELLRVLIWPLYLTGCMAIGEDRQYIMDLFKSLQTLNSGPWNKDRYTKMLEQYWQMRETDPDCSMWEIDSKRPLFL